MAQDTHNLDAAREALIAIGDRATSDWLILTDGQPEVGIVLAADGAIALTCGGLLQDSRTAPRSLAQVELTRALPEGYASEASLFGLGSPALTELLLEKTGKLTALEPAASVARAFLGLRDHSFDIRSGKLRLISPWSFANGIVAPLSPLAVVHQASRRRDPAMCRAFTDLVRGRLAKGPASDEPVRLLIVPPFSGGTLSMAGFLAKAADELGSMGKLVVWPMELAVEAESLRARPTTACVRGESSEAPELAVPPRPAGFFRKCATSLAGQAADFRPHLILALAQAPLDESGVETLKDACPDACVAFWFVEDFQRFTYVRGIAAAWDLFLHIQGRFMDRTLRDWGVRKAAYLPPCADADFFKPREAPAHYKAQVSFMGAAYPNRLRILGDLDRTLGLAGLTADNFKIFGSGWEAAGPGLKARLFDGGRRMTAEETALVYAGGEVNLNIHSGPGEGFDPGSGFVNPRTFELAATGAFQLCDPRPLMEGLFSNEEIAVVPSPEDLPEFVLDWLARPTDRARAGAAARIRTLAAHLYRHRLEAAFRIAFGT
ncbi:MAG: glycosyltransferase [Deltaproteobacteria bacterium]|jgi:spore maturation protein CgeB|nr:glycosyltransferase [Deltaproteobacteria bacterium]